MFPVFRKAIMASRINQNWVFGHSARLDFSTPTPTPSNYTLINTLEGCASISDANGNLTMYTDGMTVWDGANTIRATGLHGNSSSTQSAIIVPDPGNAARYYVFTADFTTGTHHFDGVRLDTSTSTWGVAQLSTLMTMPSTTGFSRTEKLTAIQHANCRDFWVLVPVQNVSAATAGTGPGVLRVFLVNPSGVQHVGDTAMGVNVNDVGYLKASGDGKRIALANWMDCNVMVCPFDNATGVVDVSHLVTIPVPPIPGGHPRYTYGVEFSPSGNVLYYSVIGGTGTGAANQGYVFQNDLLNPGASVQAGPPHPNAGEAGRYALGALQLGMDGKIYVAQDGETALGVIASPETLGVGCGLTFSARTLAPHSVCYMGLPNMVANPCACPCDEGNCDDAVEHANQVLNGKAGQKQFTVAANGQAPPAPCALAFEALAFAPYFTLHWGDGPNDHFESDDTEVIYIRIRNPYRNLVYRGVKVFNIRITPNQVLPDGGNALQLVPGEIVCFEQIDPCSYVSRDFAFLINHAVVQGYQIAFDYCIEETAIVGAGGGTASFGVSVVAS
jgi:hypothetical protein